MCCVIPELQGGVRNRQTYRGCTYFGSAGTQQTLALAQEQMKSQKQAQKQGLQLGTGQGQAHRVGDLVASEKQGREELAGGGGGPEISSGDRGQQGGVMWWVVLLTRAGQWPRGHQERARRRLEHSWQREGDAPRGRGEDVRV